MELRFCSPIRVRANLNANSSANLSAKTLHCLCILGLALLFSAAVLAEPPDRQGLRDAIKSLSHKDHKVREKAISQLLASSYRDSSLTPALLPLLEDPSSGVRARSANLLGEIGNPQAIDPLISSTGDSVDLVRLAAVQALNKLDARKATATLNTLIQDPSEEVALASIQTLEAFKATESVKDLTNLAINGQSYRLRSAAVRTLGNLGSAEPVSQFIVLLEFERDIWLRREIALALEKIGDDEAIKPLMRFLEEIRNEANQQTDTRRKKVYNDLALEVEDSLGRLRNKDRKKIPKKIAQPEKAKPQKPVRKTMTKPATPQSSGMASGMTAKEHQAQKAAIKKRPRPRKKAAHKTYTLQIKATANADLAKAILEDLKGKGQDAFLVDFLKDGEKWYRVRVGTFPSIEAALTHGNQLKQEKAIEDFFVTRR